MIMLIPAVLNITGAAGTKNTGDLKLSRKKSMRRKIMSNIIFTPKGLSAVRMRIN